MYVSPSGSTYNEVQWALDNATEGDTIYVAPGNYSEGMRVVTNGISVIGNSSEGEIRIGKNDMGIAAVQANWVNISGINITDLLSHISLLVITDSENVRISDVSLYSTNLSSGLYLSHSKNVHISGMNVYTMVRLPVQIMDCEDIDIEDFYLETDGYDVSIYSGGVCDGLQFRNGQIVMRNTTATGFNFTDVTNATIDNVTVKHSTSEGTDYIRHEEGTIEIYNTNIEDDDIGYIDPDGYVSVWFERKVYISFIDRSGEEIPAEGADINFTIDGTEHYSTVYYGNWDNRTDEMGTFNMSFPLLSKFYDGTILPVNGVNRISAWYKNDLQQEIDLGIIDANTTDDIHILFDKVSRRNGTLNGTVTYSGGPFNGQLCMNGTVELMGWNWDGYLTEHLDVNGSFQYDELEFESNFSLTIDPPQEYQYAPGSRSGYDQKIIEFDFVDNTTLDIVLEYVEFVPPTNGTLQGEIIYSGGPKDGEISSNATVFIYNSSMVEIANDTVDEQGRYEFLELPFGENYTVKVVPVDGVKMGGSEEGYPILEMIFHHDNVRDLNISILYYIPAISGPISGWVRYQEGPKDGNFIPNASVILLNISGDEIGSMKTDDAGYFIFEDVPFGVGYELRVSPPMEDAGVNNEETGYLFWDGSAFPHNGSTRMNASLKYYSEPAIHPRVTILDRDGEPVESVWITAEVSDEVYTAETDALGTAVFIGYDGENFPDGTIMKASRSGWEKERWEWQEPVPQMKEAEAYDNSLVFILIAVFVFIVIGAALVTMFLGRTKEEIIEE